MASFPLTCRILTGAGYNPTGVRHAGVRCNFIPLGSERQRDLQLISVPCVGRFIFPAGTDVREGSPPGFPPSVPLTVFPDADIIECPVGSSSVVAYNVLRVEDSFPGDPREYRTVWVCRVWGTPGNALPQMT